MICVEMIQIPALQNYCTNRTKHWYVSLAKLNMRMDDSLVFSNTLIVWLTSTTRTRNLCFGSRPIHRFDKGYGAIEEVPTLMLHEGIMTSVYLFEAKLATGQRGFEPPVQGSPRRNSCRIRYVIYPRRRDWLSSATEPKLCRRMSPNPRRHSRFAVHVIGGTGCV